MDGDNEAKRNILNELGSNWTLEQKKLEMLAYKWLLPIQNSQTLLNEKKAGFELMKMPENKRRSELLELLRPCVRRVRDSNPRSRLRLTRFPSERTRPLCELSYLFNYPILMRIKLSVNDSFQAIHFGAGSIVGVFETPRAGHYFIVDESGGGAVD